MLDIKKYDVQADAKCLYDAIMAKAPNGYITYGELADVFISKSAIFIDIRANYPFEVFKYYADSFRSKVLPVAAQEIARNLCINVIYDTQGVKRITA
jgi:hypothetical protein